MKQFILPGLAFYAISSGLGLFLKSGMTDPWFFPWLAGFVLLAFIVSYYSLFTKEPAHGFSFFVLWTVGLNASIQLTGGIASPLFPIYFFLTTAAAFKSRAWVYPATGLVLAVESANLLLSGNRSAGSWYEFAGFAVSLAGVAFVTAHITHRIRSEAQDAKDSYKKLLSDADAVDPLAGGTNVEALTEKKRQVSSVNAAREREGAFSGLIDMISEIVPAHTYALFLNDRNDETLTLRGIRSESEDAVCHSASFKMGHGIVGLCTYRLLPQYHPDMVVAVDTNLTYYRRNVPVRSFLAIPLAMSKADTVSGVLCVDSLSPDAFPAEVQAMLMRFTPFFIQIIEKARISAEVDIRAKNFAALHEMSQVLSSSLEINEVLDTLTTQIRSVVPYDFCAFVLYDEKNRKARLTALRGYDSAFVGKQFTLDPDIRDADMEQSAILLHMLRQWNERRVIKVHYDPDLGARGGEIGLFPFKELQRPIKSLYGRPLVARERFVGAVFLCSVQAQAFTEYHLNFMDTLLNHVSMVVDNSMLHTRIRDMAHTDGLTGLLNHRTFMDKMDEEFRRLGRETHEENRHFALLLLDIDFFKKVNDEYGHPVGDVALKTIAGVIREMARSIDFVARYGGEEFAVGMVQADLEGAKAMAERIRKSVENTTITAGRTTLKRTLSIGVAAYQRGCEKKETLISQADQALYHAKHGGRNRVSLFKDIKDLEPGAEKHGK